MRFPGIKYFRLLNIGRLFLGGDEVTATAAQLNAAAGTGPQITRIGTVTLNGINPTVVSFIEEAVATVVGTETETFDLSLGDRALIVNPDGLGNETVTFTATEGDVEGGTAGFGDLQAQADDTFLIAVDEDVDGEEYHMIELTLTNCDTGANTATEMQTKIRAIVAGEATYSAVEVAFTQDAAGPPQTGTYKITSGTNGSGSRVRVLPASANNVLEELDLMDPTETDGTGVGFNSAAATAEEVADFINAEATDFTAAATDTDEVAIFGLVPGGSLVIAADGSSTANVILGFLENEEYIGAVGLGYDTDMADAEYAVVATIVGVNKAGKADLEVVGINDKSVSGFEIVAETDASDFDVDLVIVGEPA